MTSSADRKTAPRRAPVQARAQNTIDTIFQAVELIAAQEGAAALTTNRIAERAGVSIGTLYQYFATREAIVDAIVKRERAAVMRELQSLLSRIGADMSAREMLRAFVAVYVRAYAPVDAGRRAVMKLAWQAEHGQDSVNSLREAGERIAMHLQRLQDPQLRAPTPAQVFVLTRSLLGSVRAAVLEDSALVGTPAFEDELVRMCWSLLAAP
jgi:AcrR family transcriptional regulator